MKSHILPIVILLLVNVSYSLTSANLVKENVSELRGLRGRGLNHEKDNHQPAYRLTKQDGRIIGGSEATANRHKFAVSLQDEIGHFCGGSLIAKDVVLTAAHCQAGKYDAVLGRHDLDTNDGQKIRTARELPHPNYNDRSTDNDFMLVFLKSAATLNRDVDTVTLNNDSSVPRVSNGVTVMGWGDTDIRDDVSTLSDVLMNVEVNVISNSDCDDSSGSIDGVQDDYNDQITENMLCAQANRQDSCQGDSGGPLVSGNTQVGVVSWGISCASSAFPGVYARVSRAYDWIESEVCNRSEHAAEAGFSCSGAPASSPSSPSGNDDDNGEDDDDDNNSYDDDAVDDDDDDYDDDTDDNDDNRYDDDDNRYDDDDDNRSDDNADDDNRYDDDDDDHSDDNADDDNGDDDNRYDDNADDHYGNIYDDDDNRYGDDANDDYNDDDDYDDDDNRYDDDADDSYGNRYDDDDNRYGDDDNRYDDDADYYYEDDDNRYDDDDYNDDDR